MKKDKWIFSLHILHSCGPNDRTVLYLFKARMERPTSGVSQMYVAALYRT